MRELLTSGADEYNIRFRQRGSLLKGRAKGRSRMGPSMNRPLVDTIGRRMVIFPDRRLGAGEPEMPQPLTISPGTLDRTLHLISQSQPHDRQRRADEAKDVGDVFVT